MPYNNAIFEPDSYGTDQPAGSNLVSPNSSTTGLVTLGDRDWFQFGVTSRVSLTLAAQSATSELLNTTLYLYDSSGALVHNNDDGGPQLSSLITRDLEIGTYYAVVGAFADGYAGSYRLSLASAPPQGTTPQPYVLEGGPGDDTLLGTARDEIIRGLDGNDYLSGRGGADVLEGGAGNDTLVSTVGADTVRLVGGAGDDTHHVYNWFDLVEEAAGEGYDKIVSSMTWTLSDSEDGFIEALVLTGSANVNATGNSLDNVLVGNAGENVLDGMGGSDIMAGMGGNDAYFVDKVTDTVIEAANGGIDTVHAWINRWTLGDNIENLSFIDYAALNATGIGNSLDNRITGSLGNDILDGKGGSDVLVGGLGNDSYYVDTVTDYVYEYDAPSGPFSGYGGFDKVLSSVSWTLGDFVEALVLTGSANLDATGNNLANVLIGNAGDNILDGKGAADIHAGMGGNDTYYLNNPYDTVQETADNGYDKVISSVSFDFGSQHVEELQLTGSANLNGTGNDLDNVLYGNAGNNLLDGKGGNDRLYGGLGADVLTGGADEDVLVFQTAAEANGDRITDLAAGDKIDLSAIDAIAGGADNAFAWIGTNGFSGMAGQLRFAATEDGAVVSGDIDGDGVGDFNLAVQTSLLMTAAFFVL